MTKTDYSRRLIGLAVPVSALRTEESGGVGEFADLTELADLCAELGIGLIQLLPVNDTGFESSPYSALSAFALHPLYIRIQAIPEAASFKAEAEEIKQRFDGAARFPYYKVLRAKLDLLKKVFKVNADGIRKNRALKDWIRKNPWVRTYAVFHRLKDSNNLKSWKEWKSFRNCCAKDIEELWADPAYADAQLFRAWLQYHLDAQFSAARKHIRSLGIILEGDLPILINEDSADVWAHREFFDNNYSAGAPPDMYSPDGQNWGFPVYNWEAQEKDGFSWWKQRLACAEKYFDAYRIDHVLGFFRIWGALRQNDTALLGRFIPSVPVKLSELKELGFDDGRIRWLSQPHIPTVELRRAVQNSCGPAEAEAELQAILDIALDRIGEEELWLFKPGIKGEKDIKNLEINEGGKNCLLRAWNNRLLFRYENKSFSPVWYYYKSRAWASLSGEEREKLQSLFDRKSAESEKKWEAQGRKLLTILKESSTMLPCAEDLGAVPSCVPAVLTKLGILGLRVVRWTRDWEKEGQPYIPFADYPELSVCTPAVHDSSTVREWWDREAGHEAFSRFIGAPSLPNVYNPGAAAVILKHIASAASRFRVFQIQDLLHLSPRWYAGDSAAERINTPGTCNEFNWTYRLPAKLAEISKDEVLTAAVRKLCRQEGRA